MVMLHRTLWHLAGDVRRPLIRCVLVGWLLFAVRVGQAITVGFVLGAVLDDRSGGLAWAAPLLLALVVIRGALVWARETVSQATAVEIKTQLRERLVGRVIDLGPGHLATRRTGAVQATVVDGVEGLEAYYSRYLPQLAVALTGPVLVVGWMVARAPLVGAVVAVAVIAVPTLPRLWDRVLAERGRTHWDAYAQLGADYLDAMGGMTTLKALDAADAKGAELEQRSEVLRDATMKQMGVSLIDTGLSTLGTQVGVALAIGLGAIQVAQGSLDIGTLSILLVLTFECFRPLNELSAQWHAGFLGVSAADGIAELLAAEVPSPDRVGAAELVVASSPSVRFRNVSLRYPGRTQLALDGVDLEVPAGATVALVGRSGSGKSSMVNALARFWPIDDGMIEIDGVDVCSVTARSLRSSLAIVSQDSHLFHGTVRDNLLAVNAHADDAQLWEALASADARGIVEAMPGGLDGAIGDRGATLSGGQRQRIALARALLADAPVLVLDEPTSAVDAEAEHRIMTSIRTAARDRTVLIIAHRLSTIRHADQIAVMEHGRVAERGTHDELIAADGVYAALHQVMSSSEGADRPVAAGSLEGDRP